jgi:hypothetical protein
LGRKEKVSWGVGAEKTGGKLQDEKALEREQIGETPQERNQKKKEKRRES